MDTGGYTEALGAAMLQLMQAALLVECGALSKHPAHYCQRVL
jgi:hypothetical protein